MIKRVVSVDGYHNYRVAWEIQVLQENGNKIVSVKRIEKMLFGMFGDDVTEIIYKKKK